MITDIKTAADSELGARYLARPDARHLVVLGAGTVAGNVIADLREADDDVLTRSQNNTNSRDTTLGHIDELKILLAAGTIGEVGILADLYQRNAERLSSEATMP